MNNTNLKFKDILYHILDNGDIGNGWKYVEVVDKKGGFSLPKCLYYKGESMKNLLEYSDYINHLDTGKGFINDFVKDIFRECYPGSTNPICKIKENVMMGGGNSDDDDDDDDDGDEAAASKSGQEPQAAASVAGPTGEGEETAADTVGPAASTTGADTTGGDEKGGQPCTIDQIVKTIESLTTSPTESPTLLKKKFDKILDVVYKVGSESFYPPEE